jgi:hypothetical protein
VPEGLLNPPLASRREVGDAGIDPSGRPGVERHRGRDVGVPQSSNDGRDGRREGAVEVSRWGRTQADPKKKKKAPGRLRAAGLVALNSQPNCEGAEALTSGQSRHPTRRVSLTDRGGEMLGCQESPEKA